MSGTSHARLATLADLPALVAVMDAAIAELQRPFLSPAQIAASRKVMGLDRQLVVDGTYYLVEVDGAVAGCGGWSFRATLYGGDDSIVAREPQRLDPTRDAAKIRAMYTNPAFARRGIGRLVLATCEGAAAQAGFKAVELMATAAGVPLYQSAGYAAVAEVMQSHVDGVSVPLVLMRKPL